MTIAVANAHEGLERRTPDGYRRAALCLHAMTPSDREWLMAELAPGHRLPLQELLGELRTLGVQPDPMLLEAANVGLSAAAVPQDTRTHDRHSMAAALGRIDPAMLCALLAKEPDALIGRVLAMQDWPWSAQLLDHVGPTRRRIISAIKDEFNTAASRTRPSSSVLDLAILTAIHRCSLAATIQTGATTPPARKRPQTLPARSIAAVHSLWQRWARKERRK
jgi:hypothetical protein